MRNVSLWLFLTFLLVVNPFTVYGAGAAPMSGTLPEEGTTLTVSDGGVTIPLTLVPTTYFDKGTISVVLHFSGVSTVGPLLTDAVYAQLVVNPLVNLFYTLPSGFGANGVKLGPGSTVTVTGNAVNVVVYLNEVTRPPGGGGGTPGGGGGAVLPGPTTTTTGTETGWQKYDASTGTCTVYVDPEKTRSLYAAAPKDGVVLVKPPAVLAGGLVPPNVTASLPLDVVNLGGSSTVRSVLNLGAIEMKLAPEVVKSLGDGVRKGAGTLGSLQVRVQASSDQATKATLGSLPPQALTNMTPASQVITVTLAAVDPQGKETALSMDKGSVSVSFNPEAVRDTRKVNLYMIGSLVYVGGKVDLANNRVSADLVQTKGGRFIALEYSKTFKDIEAHWAKGNIELMASKYIVQGMTDDEFWPQDPVTRAQFVTLLARSLGIPEFKPAGATFTDVGSGAWYYGYVEAAYKAGLTTGDNGKGGLFRPGDTISRQEMAAMLTRAMKVYGAPARDVSAAEVKALLDRFTDGSSLGDWARTEAAQAVNEGLIKGRDDGRFDPAGNGTRAEAATMMSRLMKRVGIL
jgi:hypothetical protein